MDSRDTASATFDVADPAGDAAGRAGLARAGRDGTAQGDDLHAGQAADPTAGNLTAGSLADRNLADASPTDASPRTPALRTPASRPAVW